MASVRTEPAGRSHPEVGGLRQPTWARAWWRGRYGAPLVAELAVLATVLFLYKWVRYAVGDQSSVAFENAGDVIRLEEMLGLFNEQSIQDFALSSEPLLVGLNWFYAKSHFAVTAAAGFLLYIRSPQTYVWFRRTLIGVTLVALAIHVSYPLAPPRMLSDRGFVDTLAVYGPDVYGDSWVARHANQFAAMPSLHFGYALVVGWACCRAFTSRWTMATVAYPTLMFFAVAITANHFWLDSVVAGALVVGVGMLCADQPTSGRIRVAPRPGREVVSQPD